MKNLIHSLVLLLLVVDAAREMGAAAFADWLERYAFATDYSAGA